MKNLILSLLMLLTVGFLPCNGQTSDLSKMSPTEVVDKFYNNYVRFGDIDNAMQLLHPDGYVHKSRDKTDRQYLLEVGTPRLLKQYHVEIFNETISEDGNSALVDCNLYLYETGERKYFGRPILLKKTLSGWKIMEVEF